MKQIGLTETIEALRTELSAAMAAGTDQAIQFPVGSVQLEFHVGVTKDVNAKAGVKFWVVELGTEGSYTNESIQKVVVTLEPPIDREGHPVRVRRGYDEKP
jgi:hypothetical protein